MIMKTQFHSMILIILSLRFFLFVIPSDVRTQGDAAPPELVDFSFAPNSINVSSSSQDVSLLW